MSKADSMLAILWLLKSRKLMTARQLAEELEIHIRTVYRCIDALAVSGVPIIAESGRNGGYRIQESFAKAPLFFELDEQKALVHAAVFAQEAGYPYGEALNRAINKLKRYTTPEQLDALERHESGLEVIHPPTQPELSMLLQQLEQATAERNRVAIDYRTGYEGVFSKRDIDPYGLIHWKSKWYVVGYCHLRKEIRSFRVDRIQALAVLETGFERPEPFSAREFMMDSLLPRTDDSSELISVRIEGSSQAIDDLCGHWLFGHALADRTAESAHFRLDEQSVYMQAPHLLMSFGRQIRVKEPDGLRASMRDIAARLLSHFES